jgi:MFS family permease
MEKILNKNLMLSIIVASSILCLTASDICLPSIPQIAEYFSVSDANAQFSISFFLGGQVAATLFWGTFSDRVGRLKAFFLGMLLFFIGTLVCMSNISLELFLAGRLIEGIGSVVIPVVGWAIIQDLYPKDKSARIMTWMGSIISLAPMAAPAFGGQIDKFFGWQADFYFIALFTFIIARESY